MRTATIVLVAYFSCVILGAVWRLMPWAIHDAVPDLGALTAAYLGLTARRNVADRIDRFLNGLQGARRLPNRRELFWLREALVKLEEGQYPAGEDAMDKAERTLAIPEHASNDPSTNAGATVEQLRAQLDQIMKAE